MAAVRTVDADVLAAALQTLAGASWPVPVDEVPGLVASLGWTVVAGTGGRSLQADTGWALSSAAADFSSDRLGLATVSFAVTDDLLDASPWRGRFLREAFTDAVAVATRDFGEPTGRIAGPTPQVWWDLPGDGRLEIARRRYIGDRWRLQCRVRRRGAPTRTVTAAAAPVSNRSIPRSG